MSIIAGQMPVSDLLISCAIGYAMDLCIGDPPRFPHPVRGIGWLIRFLESRLFGSSHRRLTGCILLLATVAVTCLSAWGLMLAAGRFGRAAQIAMAGTLIWTSLATRDLLDHSSLVDRALVAGDLSLARTRLSAIVSRNTSTLNESDVARGCVETIAENLVDGIVSPLFFAFLGGPVAAYAFKAVSTLDSMVGYRNEHYREFGWASARADDVLNYLPARLMFLVLPLAALCVNPRGALNSFRSMLRDGGKNPSPNSGIPESGFAGALGIQLGGINIYSRGSTLKPLLNEGAPSPALVDIRRAQRLLLSSSNLCFIFFVILRLFL
jgi:adenosylcobinamide-phosphate synthase